MKRYFKKDNNFEYERLYCELDMEDVLSAEKELVAYLSCIGATYARDKHKEPKFSNFFYLYFGEYFLEDGFEWYEQPDVYICDTKETADRLMQIAGKLAYYDTFHQEVCEVKQDGNTITVVLYDY